MFPAYIYLASTFQRLLNNVYLNGWSVCRSLCVHSVTGSCGIASFSATVLLRQYTAVKSSLANRNRNTVAPQMRS